MKKIFLLFLTWRILLFTILFLAISIVPLQMNFLGGGLESYLAKPYLWAWVNFDGEHFLSIAYRGYQPLTYFFFPVYPLITKYAAYFLGDSFTNLAVSGLIVSNISFFVALMGLWKLFKLDYRKDVVLLAVILLLSFPASFYFASLYSESLFLALAVWSLYFARKKNWILAGLLGGLSTATRLVGIALVPALIAEAWIQYKKDKKTNMVQPIIGTLLVPLGILAYMYFLNLKTGDPLEFFHSVGIFGEQRSTSLILLPQVFYRYFFKILPNLNYNYFPVVFTTFFELITALILTFLSILAFFRLRLSYAVYLLVGFIIPTLSGSFSSLPRYVLTLFPAFLLTAVYLSRLKRNYRIIFTLITVIFLGIATALFARGYWVA
ncbi:MAG: mannosyltransferase family protein [Patescibacteria group bacterium]